MTDSQRITGNTVLSGQSRADLLVMTPMQYRTARTAQARELAALPVTTDFVIDVFERRG